MAAPEDKDDTPPEEIEGEDTKTGRTPTGEWLPKKLVPDDHLDEKRAWDWWIRGIDVKD